MRKILSTAWPWMKGTRRWTPAQAVAVVLAVGADEVCIRTPVYGTENNPVWHDEYAKRLQDGGVDLSIWPVVNLYDPEKEADSIGTSTLRYMPKRIVIDAEQGCVVNIAKLPRFLTRMGQSPVPVGLGSFRRPTLHEEMNWMAWLTARIAGQYVIDFMAAQLYPIGWIAAKYWVQQFTLDIEAWEKKLAQAGRAGLPWIPWMPTFIGGTYEGQSTPWSPKPESMDAAISYMRGCLGERLIGLNFWSLDRDLVDMPDLLKYVTAIPKGGQDAPTPSFLQLPETARWELVERSLKQQHILDAAGVPVEV